MDLVALILFAWAHWLSKQPGAPRWLRFLGPALIVNCVGALGATVLARIHVFRSIGTVDAGHKAQVFSDGIAWAMSFTAFGLAFDVVALVLLVMFTLRLRRSSP